jgi:hypothetical protein
MAKYDFFAQAEESAAPAKPKYDFFASEEPAKPKYDFFSIEGPSKQKPIRDFLKGFGEAAAMAPKIAGMGVVQPETAAQLPAGALQGVTLGAVDINPPKSTEEQVAREAGKLFGLGGPLKVIRKIFQPLGFWGKFLGAGTAGASIKAANDYFKGNEQDPTGMAIDAGIWMGLEGVNAVYQGLNYISKATGKSKIDVMKWFASKFRSKVKDPFVTEPTPQALETGTVKVKPEAAQEAETIIKEEMAKPVEQMAAEISAKPEKPQVEPEIEAKKPEIEPIHEKKSPEMLKPVELVVKPEPTAQATFPETKPKPVVKTPKEKKQEPEKKEAKELPVNKSTGYQHKATPVTHEEKVNHLVGKIHDSRTHIENLKSAIVKARDRVKEQEAKLKNITDSAELKKERQKLIEYRSALDNNKLDLSNELRYRDQLKRDLADLKKNKENSKVQLPLGRRNVASKPTPSKTALQPQMGKRQAKKRSDILNIFRKAFNDPIRLGKIKGQPKGTVAIHKVFEKVTRLLRDNDIESAAHEIGHNLHTFLYAPNVKNGKEALTQAERALKPYAHELDALGDYEPFRLEGFAEFTRLYVTNPDVAKQLAPTFYDKFEAELGADHPEMLDALLQARDYYDSYIKGTPESRTLSSMNLEPNLLDKLKNKVQDVKDYFSELPEKIVTQIYDDLYPLKKMMAELFDISPTEVETLGDPRNVYRAARVLRGAVDMATTMLEYETMDYKSVEVGKSGYLKRKRTGEGLKQVLEGLSDADLVELRMFMVHQRNLEKLKQGFDTPFPVGDSQFIIQKYGKKYAPIAERLRGFMDRILQYYRDSGMLSLESYNAIKKANEYYIPWNRVLHPEYAESAPRQYFGAGGKLQAARQIKRFKGSLSDLEDPFVSMIKNTYAFTLAAEKNRVGQMLASLAKTVQGAGKFVERVPAQTTLKARISKEEIVDKMIKKISNGAKLTPEQKEGLKESLAETIDLIPDTIERWGAKKPAGNIITVYHRGKPTYYEVSPEIYDVWEKGLSPYSANIIVRILSPMTRTLRTGAILNPKFWERNLIKDTWARAIFTRNGKKGLKALVDAIYAPIQGLAHAAGKSDLYLAWLQSGGGLTTMSSMDTAQGAKTLEQVRKGLRPWEILKILRSIGNISEEANRLAEFGTTLNHQEQSRIGLESAAFYARDVSIDYAKGGMVTKSLTQIIAFLASTLQGGGKLVRAIINPKDRAEFARRMAIFVTIPSALLWWYNRNNDEEKIEEQPDYTKDFYFLTSTPTGLLTIPVPFEAGVLAHGLTQRFLDYALKKDPNAFEGFFGSINAAALPSFVPTELNPLIEHWANRNFYTGRKIIPANKESLIPELQYKDYTSVTARLVGRCLSYAFGPEKVGSYASPAIIDNYINGWFGGLGRLSIKFLDASLRAAGLADDIPKMDRPFVEQYELNAFQKHYPTSDTKSIQKFYEHYQKATRIHKSLKPLDELEMEETYKKIEGIYNYHDMVLAYKAMQRHQKAINMISKDPTIPSDEKSQLIDQEYLYMIDFARAVNKDIDRHFQENKK